VVTRNGGFTLVELLVATSVTLVAVGVAVMLVMQAGAGFSLGWGAGSASVWPPILPCRWDGTPLASVAGGCASADSITIVSMAATAPQALTSATADDRSGPIRLVPVSACRLDAAACRLHAGSLMLIADGTGAFDLFPATAVSVDGGLVTHPRNRLSGSYAAGALIGEISTRSYYRATDAATGVQQLRRAAVGGTSFPVVEDAVGLSFEYFGEPTPPIVINPDDPLRRAVSYGPMPPPLGVDNPFDPWLAGENCTFAVAGDRQVSRLAAWPAGGGAGLAPVPLQALSDGPWCPDSGSANRYDADLLRIRLVRVTLKLRARRAIPDLEVRFDVALQPTRR
jgi:hypothetical protein